MQILDEAQRVKNAESQTHRNLNRIKAKRRLLLTGTPVEVCIACLGGGWKAQLGGRVPPLVLSFRDKQGSCSKAMGMRCALCAAS